MVWCPLLAENVPHGWTVYLVDTPGMGEAKQHVEEIASEALEASAAYIYLLQPDNIEGQEVRDTLSSLKAKDVGKFGGPFLISVKFKFVQVYYKLV